MKNLIVETTSRCNLSCSMCLRYSWRDPEGDMDPEMFRSLLSSCPKLESLSLSGYGEPFVHPSLVDMIRMARRVLSTRCRIHLTSNGTLIDRNSIRDVIEAGLNGIALSMDSLHADAFTSMRGGASLRTVTETLEHLAAFRENRPFFIEISTVAMGSNIQELPALIRFAAEHRVDRVWVNNILPYREELAGEILYDSHSEDVLKLFSASMERLRGVVGNPGYVRALMTRTSSLMGSTRSAAGNTRPAEEEALVELAQGLASPEISMGGNTDTMLRLLERDTAKFARFAEIFQDSREVAAKHGVGLQLPLLVPKTKRECNFIQGETCFITWDGWVRPCNQLSHDYSCFHYGRPKAVKSVSFGKILEESLESVWNSEAYAEFRKKVAEFPFSPCGNCGLADGCGYIAPDRDFLCDCNMCEQPCGDCMWSRGILQCP